MVEHNDIGKSVVTDAEYGSNIARVKRISVEASLSRYSEIDKSGTGIALRSVLAVDPDAEMRTQAVAVPDGPLSGVPVLVKDNIEALGLPCSAGSLALRDVPVGADSTVASRLRRAGAVIIGAANLSEWANIRSTRSSSGWSAVGGLVSNPWSLDRSAGGSSSGSGASVAAGIVPMAVGTETDGSITCPAALNGVVGIKPTVGLVPTDGVVPVSGTQDTPGSLGRSVDEAALMLAVLADDAGFLERTRSVDVGSLRLGVVESWFTGHSATDSRFDEVLASLSYAVGHLKPAHIEVTPAEVTEDEFRVLIHELRSDLDAYLGGRCANGGPKSLQEVIDFNRSNHSEELFHFGQELFEMAAASSGRSASEYAEARSRNLAWIHNQLEPMFTEHDVLIAPAYMPAWKTDFVLGHPPAGGAVTTPAAIAGLPIVTVPMGLVADLPVALSLVGAPKSEAMLVGLARVIEQQLGLVDDPEWRPRFRQPSRS
ncbi:MAG: amidase [Actinobacteria bacterium]|nr:amidase [Actinomycetota bacterium]